MGHYNLTLEIDRETVEVNNTERCGNPVPQISYTFGELHTTQISNIIKHLIT